MSSGCGEGVLAHLVQRGEHLPGHVALQTADDLLLGLALLETLRHVVLGLLVVAQPHQHDPIQRGVGLAVTAAVEPVAVVLPEDAWIGEASLRSRSGLSPAATSSAPALSWPTPNSATSWVPPWR